MKLYRKNFGRERPETIRSIEEIVAAQQAKKQAKKAARAARPQQPEPDTLGENAMQQEPAERPAEE